MTQRSCKNNFMTIGGDVRQSQCNMASDKNKKMDLDSETNKLYTSYLSAKDAHKAKNGK